MRSTCLFALLAALALTGSAAVAQKKDAPPLDLKGKTLQQTFDELLPKLDGQTAQQQWQSICFQLSAPGYEAQRGEACKLMITKLGKDTPNAARVWLLKQLERIGRAESIDAIATAIDDKEPLVRDAAVRALTNNPAPEATAKLASKLASATGAAKVGVLNGLGQRADATSVAAVAKELSSTETPVAVAAARTLGRIATPEAAKALADARGKATGEVRLAVSDAYLRYADRLLKDGKVPDATAIYHELNKADEPRSIRFAALQGVLKSAGDQAGTRIVEILGGTDADARDIAIGQIENLNAAALKPLAANLEKLPATSQVLVLTAIASRGDKSLLPTALAAAKSKDATIQRAGILALGRLGDASVVALLIESLFAGGNAGGAAAESLGQLTADGVNEKLVAALEGEKSAGRVTSLIGVLERRRAVSAIPALLKAAQSDDAAVRIAAFAGLKNLAEAKHIPEMVQALAKTDKGKEREQAELAIVAVCGLIAEPEKRAEPVLAVFKAGGKAQGTTLLPLLGRLGGANALPFVKEALASTDPQLHEAGLAAICNWPEPSVSEDLLKLMQGEKDEKDRLRALQALVRVNTTQPSDRPSEAKVASFNALKKAMELANRVEERRLILDGIGFIRVIETYRYVLPYLDDKEVQQSACRALVELAHSRPLREPLQAEFNKTLDRVIAVCKDKGLIDRARSYKQ